MRGRLEWLSTPLKIIPPATGTAATTTATARPSAFDAVDIDAKDQANEGGGLRETWDDDDRDDDDVGFMPAPKEATPSGASEEGGGGGGAAVAPATALVGIAAAAVIVLAALVAMAWGPRRFGGGAGALVSAKRTYFGS